MVREDPFTIIRRTHPCIRHPESLLPPIHALMTRFCRNARCREIRDICWNTSSSLSLLAALGESELRVWTVAGKNREISIDAFGSFDLTKLAGCSDVRGARHMAWQGDHLAVSTQDRIIVVRIKEGATQGAWPPPHLLPSRKLLADFPLSHTSIDLRPDVEISIHFLAARAPKHRRQQRGTSPRDSASPRGLQGGHACRAALMDRWEERGSVFRQAAVHDEES